MREFDAFQDVPKIARKADKTIREKIIASYRDKEFYDGDRTPRFRLAGTEYGLSEKAYIRRYWTHFIDPALQVLSAMLAMPGVDEKEKEAIYDAITAFHGRSTTKLKPALSLRSLN